MLFTFSLIFISSGNYVFANQYVDPLIVLETNTGNIVIEVFPYDAPNHVRNFLGLIPTGYYEGTLFHRIIPGFMIQGGDPNTIDGDPNTWGQGGPDKSISAEFNNIKHERGIVSMARSSDPDSAGSQFFIVHQNSNFLDGEYTVFGRIVSEESFETLDKIADMETNNQDAPLNIEDVRILKTSIVPRSDISDLLELLPPERKGELITRSTGNQIFESKELDIAFSAPEGWLLQQSNTLDKLDDPSTPDVVAVGPKIGGVNPVISLTINDVGNQGIDELIREKNKILNESVSAGQLEIISQKKIKSNVYQTLAIGDFILNDKFTKIKFLDVLILSEQKSYTFAYSNVVKNFDVLIPRFNESLDSFKILSQDNTIMETSNEENSTEEGGGCLIATAAYGSEMAPQVQLLREIRDNQLMNTESGSAFMTTFNEMYYSFSPYIADMERESPLFKEAVKLGLTPMLSSLAIMQNADSESEVLGLGLSVIALNIGMYLGIPAIIIIGIKKRN